MHTNINTYIHTDRRTDRQTDRQTFLGAHYKITASMAIIPSWSVRDTN